MKRGGKPFWLKAGIFIGIGLVMAFLSLELSGFFSGSLRDPQPVRDLHPAVLVGA